jgi:hypothetical protein
VLVRGSHVVAEANFAHVTSTIAVSLIARSHLKP